MDGRIDHCLDCPALMKVRRVLRSAVDGVKEFRDLHDLQFIEPELMPARHTEVAVRRMLRTRLDAYIAGGPTVLTRSVVQKLIQALLTEHQRTLGPGQFEGQLHLAPGRGPIRLARAATAAFEPHDQSPH